jgi:muramoyltetrapeptide carboxypeptidase
MLIRPPYLQKNDKVAIVATAKAFSFNELEAGIKSLEAWGLQVVKGKNLYKAHHQFAGNDEERLHDLQTALDDHSIKAILCVRGGYGTNRIIDKVNFKKFLKNPKWIIGFSDVTVLHAHLHQKKIQTIHSLMPIQFGKPVYQKSLGTLKDALFGKQVKYITRSYKLNRAGNASALVVGGNLSILTSLIGTPSDVDTKGKILFIEDIGEYLYRLDRMILQLKRAGKLSKLKGIIVGHMTDMLDNDIPFGKTANEIIAEAVKEYKYPVCFNFPTGHEPQNFAMLCGREAQLKVGSDKVELKFKS